MKGDIISQKLIKGDETPPKWWCSWKCRYQGHVYVAMGVAENPTDARDKTERMAAEIEAKYDRALFSRQD